MGRLAGWLAVAVSIVVVGVVARVATSGRAPCTEYTPTTVEEIDVADGCVTLKGQGHYEVVVRQRVPGNILVDDHEYHLFPVFPPGKTDARAIRLLVRTERAPDSMVTYETMTLSGRLQPVTTDEVPAGTEVAIGKRSNYYFTDAMVLLVPDTIESEGEVWTAPHVPDRRPE